MRKLVSVQIVRKLSPIEGADKIEVAHVNDWQCVVKRGEFKEGDLCIYAEIDSLLPMTPPFEFLASRGTKKSELEDGTIVEGYRLRTIRLKGQLSQGLALPLSSFAVDGPSGNSLPFNINTGVIVVGEDVTELLGVHKYEMPMNASLRGTARGNFPSFARKSDQERCQNIRREIWDAYVSGDEFQVTVKLDGSSMTVYKIDEKLAEQFGTESRFGVASRNIDLKETDGNAFWDIARHDGIENKLSDAGTINLVVQGELISPSIQGNFEGVTRPEFYVYNMFDIATQEWLEPNAAKFIAESTRFNYVPVLHERVTLSTLFPDATQDTIIQKLLDYADGPSAFGGKFREGVVFKGVDGKFSWKCISNKYLEKEKD